MSRRILIATDAWHPQVNGVVRTLDTTVRTLRQMGHEVAVISPYGYRQIPIPFYPEIPLCWPWPNRVEATIRKFQPQHVHIATEGPIGLVVRHLCQVRGWNFTTSYHTKFPEYLRTMVGFSRRLSYWFLRRFHNSASAILAATPSLEAELKSRGFTSPIRRWSRGVDLNVFGSAVRIESVYPRPVLLYVGRVSAEKGIEDFLKLDTPGTKVIVGDGPARADLESRYPQAKFLGYRSGADLASCYASADLFVFPSKTDTFGLVMIEALACGLPVAAYPVTGPIDIVTNEQLGVIDDDLSLAIAKAQRTGNRAACIQEGRQYTWDRCTQQFLGNLVAVK
jgi:glycosyltransferase involved in cell wall biosynthesis